MAAINPKRKREQGNRMEGILAGASVTDELKIGGRAAAYDERQTPLHRMCR
jgi:hypothetical protein